MSFSIVQDHESVLPKEAAREAGRAHQPQDRQLLDLSAPQTLLATVAGICLWPRAAVLRTVCCSAAVKVISRYSANTFRRRKAEIIAWVIFEFNKMTLWSNLA